MKIESRVWKILNLLAILLTVVVPAYVAWYGPSTATEKRLEWDKPFAVDFATGLKPLGDRLLLSISVDSEKIKNIASSTMTLTNTGTVAVTPHDIYDNISINATKPWKILSIVANDAPVSSDWHRVNDQKFEAKKLLLNPGDSIKVNVYLTNTEIDQPSQEQTNNIGLSWSARILNLKVIDMRSDFPHIEAGSMWFAHIELYGWGLVVTLALSILFMTNYMYLMYDYIFHSKQKWLGIICIVSVGFLSVAASESISTYLFPSLYIKIVGASNWMNIPWIIVNFVGLAYLWWKSYNSISSNPPSKDPRNELS